MGASEINPFNMEDVSWMSLEHYADKAVRFPQTEEPEEEAEEPKAAEQQPVPASVPEQQEIAQPVRPLNLPVMPGTGQGYGLSVGSTQEGELSGEEKIAQPVRPLNLPAMPGAIQAKGGAPAAHPAGEGENTSAGIDDKKWKDAKTTAKNTAKAKTEERQMPINVRLATLPDGKMKSAAGSPVISSRKKAADAAVAKKKTQEAGKDNPEACAALTAYRKRQLEAIESDRQTLKALQSAISELGLNKQLDFMTEAGTSMAAPAKPAEAPPAAPGATKN